MASAERNPWNPRSEDVSRFTEGDCHIFAWAINRITGWPIATFDCDRVWDDNDCGSVHAFNVLPDGRVVDVEGIRGLDEFMGAWKGYPEMKGTFTTYPWRKLRKEWGGPQYGHFSYARARKVARELLDHFDLRDHAHAGRARGKKA